MHKVKPQPPEQTKQHPVLPCDEQAFHSQRYLTDRLTFRDRLWLVAAADEVKCKQRELSPEPSTQSHTPPAVSCCKRVQWKHARHKGPQSKIPLSDDPSPCTPYCFQKVRTQGKQEASRVQMVCSEHLFSLKRALLPALLTLNRWTTPKIRQ